MAGRAPLRALTGRRRSCTARFATSIVWPMMEPFFESNSAHPVGKCSRCGGSEMVNIFTAQPFLQRPIAPHHQRCARRARLR